MNVARMTALGLCALLPAACGYPAEYSVYGPLRTSLNGRFIVATDERGGRSADTAALQEILQRSTVLPSGNQEERVTSLLYFETAKAQSAIAWDLLAQGRVDEAEEMYARSNRTLVEGDNEFSANWDNLIGGGRNMALAMSLMATAQAANPGRGAFAGISALNQHMATYMRGVAMRSMATQVPTANPSLLAGTTPDTDGRRMIVVPSSGPLMNHGHLLVDRNRTCTGGLVGYRLYITNAHCVFRSGTQLAPGRIAVQFNGLTNIDEVNAQDVLPSPAYRPGLGRNQPREAFVDDWALIVLDRHPHGRGFYGVLPGPGGSASPPGGRADVFLAGFSGDLNDGRFLSLDWGCAMTQSSDPPLALTSCLSAPGASGSPVLLTGTARRGHYIVSLDAFGSPSSPGASTGGGPLASRFFGPVAELRRRIGLPQGGTYPDQVDGALAASVDVPTFEVRGPPECRVAGTWVRAGSVNQRSVEGAKLTDTYNISSPLVMSGSDTERVAKNVSDYPPTGGNIWDLSTWSTGFGSRFLYTKVAPGPCRP